MSKFVHEDLNDKFASFEDIYRAINEQKIKERIFKNKQINTVEKTIAFVYLNIMKIPDSDKIHGVPISSNFMTNVKNNLFNTKPNLHHSHITGEIYGYAHGFCNRKVRENKNTTSVIAHNLFGFDFFFLLKVVRFGMWKTTNLNVGGSNLSRISFANISDQVKFVDTIDILPTKFGKASQKYD